TWNWRAAAENYDDAYRLNPDDIHLLRLYAHFASYTGQAALARSLAEHAIAVSPETPSLHFRLGTVALNERNLGAAIGAFERAITLDPKFANAHLYLGIALAAASRPVEAISELEVAKTLLSLSPMPYQLSLLAYGYHRADAPEAAATVLRRYADLSGSSPDGAGGRIFASLADGDMASARNSLRAAIDLVRRHHPDVSFNTLMLVKTNAFLDPAIGQDPMLAQLRAELDGMLLDARRADAL
ncbi:MAG TPA: tetratricopeptide repeat protein, partial [Gammaproteobacteria bacterium]|nr:tetratricopeptide repeat protein [Gammaproteobacteria bacterium]